MIRLQQTDHGLGSEVKLTLIVKKESEAKQIFKSLWSEIKAFEERFTRFKTSSELSHVNSEAGVPTKISPAFRDLVLESKRLAEQTAGLYNPFVLPALQKAGYVGSWPSVEKYEEKLNYKNRSGLNKIDELDIKGNIMAIPSNSALDFGGIGKGYLLDKLADLVEAKHVKDYWFSIGGDIICSGFNLENSNWKVGVAGALETSKLVGSIENTRGNRLAIATSGVTKRRGSNWNHIINPKTGKPAGSDVLTASVSYSSATKADVFAKCLVIVGSKMAKLFLDDQLIEEALLQVKDDDSVKVIRYGS
jgi:thiamine biosynthesis lipoprotein